MDDRAIRLQRALLEWFRAKKRDFPWRRTRDPYAILVAEVLLQRTRIKAGLPYYERFLGRFPTVRDLASASEGEVLRAWEGLGFYGRARRLHAAAKSIVAHHGGSVPPDFDALRSLPGIGPYTAGAVASIAFGTAVPAVDGNARRVLARLFWSSGSRESGAALDAIARSLVPSDRPGEWNQALMELGATVCVPLRPRCDACPVSTDCDAFVAGVQDRVPPRRRSGVPPTVTVRFALVERRNRVLLVRRPSNGLLAGLWSLPGGEVETDDAFRALVRDQTGLHVEIGESVAEVAHTFSHRRWAGDVVRARTQRGRTRRACWFTRSEFALLPLVPFHRRILSLADEPKARR